MASHPQSILITGASSGIGEALALHYAAPGVRLTLTGRDVTRLDAVVIACHAKGAVVDGVCIDVRDRDAMQVLMHRVDHAHPLDLVIANAGISGGTAGVAGEAAEQVRAIFAVNLDGVLNTVLPIVPVMQTRGRGQIALISSLAAFTGWPGAPAYSASKAAVRIYGEALRGSLRKSGVHVNVVCPGFIESRMTAVNGFKMPMLMSADKAARIIARGLAHNCGRIAFPWPTYILSGFLGLLPPALTSMILTKMPEKTSVIAEKQ